MTNEEKVEDARRKAAEAQARSDRERELQRRASRAQAEQSQPSLIVHGPVQQ